MIENEMDKLALAYYSRLYAESYFIPRDGAFNNEILIYCTCGKTRRFLFNLPDESPQTLAGDFECPYCGIAGFKEIRYHSGDIFNASIRKMR